MAELPSGEGWLYEPKWDGFRCLAFREGDEVLLQSKAGQPLGRYFPEMVEALRALPARKFVLDGEITIIVEGRLSFDDLLLRIHPAESRIRKLSHEIPATYRVFDLLVDEKGESLVQETLERRREGLERFFERVRPAAAALIPRRAERTRPRDDNAQRNALAQDDNAQGWHAERTRPRDDSAQRNALAQDDRGGRGPSTRAAKSAALAQDDNKRRAEPTEEKTRILLSPASRDRTAAERWMQRLAASGLDGVIAKRLEAPYASGERTAMVKVKRIRTADCVVGGFRYASKGGEIGSLLLGLYNDTGQLDHVGFTSSFTAEQRHELRGIIEPLKGGPGFSGRAPGGPSRWSTERSGQWEPLRPKLVCEVRYDYFNSGRFRHGTKFLRWRPEKTPRQCTFEQVQPVAKGPGISELDAA